MKPVAAAPWRRPKRKRPARTPESQAIVRTRILALLAIAPGLQTKEINETLDIGWQTAAQALRALEAAGLICRIKVPDPDSNPTRSVRWCLTTHWYLFEVDAPPVPPRRRQTHARHITADDLARGMDDDGGVFTADIADSMEDR